MRWDKKRITSIFLKALIAVFSFVYIFQKLKLFQEQELILTIKSETGFWLPVLVLILMPFNWIIESVKWKYLIKKIEDISLFKSVSAVFSGISFAVFTPNRIGELVGRIFVLKNEHRFKAVFITGVGSFSQMLVTVFAGLIGGILFLFFYDDLLPSEINEYMPALKIGVILVFILGLVIIFNLKFFIHVLQRFKISEKFIGQISVISEYSFREILSVLAFSLFRYAVFTVQFYLLLVFFNVGVEPEVALMCISLTYLVSSVIPSFTLTEIGIRGSAALFFMGLFSEESAGIISATALIWIINLALPAILGAFVFSRTRI